MIKRPHTYQSLDSIDYRTRSPIRAQDWQNLAAGTHFQHSHSGTRITGFIFRDPDTSMPFLYGSDQQWRSDPDNDARRLDECTTVFKPSRLNEADETRVRLYAFGFNFVLKTVFKNLNTGQEEILQISPPGGWKTDYIALSKSFLSFAGEIAPIEITFSIKSNVYQDPDTALYHITLLEEPFPTQ